MTQNLNRIRHADRVNRMASAVGVDLDEKMMEGQLDGDTLDDAVLRCTGCADVAGCERWLAAQEGIAEQAPGMCRNAGLFTLLGQGRHV